MVNQPLELTREGTPGGNLSKLERDHPVSAGNAGHAAIHPGDGNGITGAYKLTNQDRKGPSALCLGRPGMVTRPTPPSTKWPLAAT